MAAANISGSYRTELKPSGANKTVMENSAANTTSSTTPTSVVSGSLIQPSSDNVTLSQHALHTLGSSVCRALVDRDYSTRKQAAHGIEDIIKFFQDKEIGLAKERTNAIITLLVEEFLCKEHRDAKIGGAVGLVGAARGLQENLKYYLEAIVKPIMQTCIESRDVAVKYYAAECLYNLTLVAPSDVIVFLNELIDIQFELAENGDPNLLKASDGLKRVLVVIIEKHASENQMECIAEKIYTSIVHKAGIAGSKSPAFHSGFYLALLALVFQRAEVLQELKKIDSKLLRLRVTHTAACLVKLSPFLHDPASALPELEKAVKRCGILAANSAVTQNNDLSRDFEEELSSFINSSCITNETQTQSGKNKLEISDYLITIFLSNFFFKADRINPEVFNAKSLAELDDLNVFPVPFSHQLLLGNATTLVKVISAIFPKTIFREGNLGAENYQTLSDHVNDNAGDSRSVSPQTIRTTLRGYQHILGLVIEEITSHPALESQHTLKRFLEFLAQNLTKVFHELDDAKKGTSSPLQDPGFVELLVQWINWLSPKYTNEEGIPQECLTVFIKMLTTYQSCGLALPTSKIGINISRLANSLISTESSFAPTQIMYAILTDMHNSSSIEVIHSHLSLCSSMLKDSSLKKNALEELCKSMLNTIQSLPAHTLRDYLSKELVEILVYILCIWTGKAPWKSSQSWLVRQLSSAQLCLPSILHFEPLRPWLNIQIELLVIILEIPEMIAFRKSFGNRTYQRFCDHLPVVSPAFNIAHTRANLEARLPTNEIEPIEQTESFETLPSFLLEPLSDHEWDAALVEITQKINLILVPFVFNKLSRYSIIGSSAQKQADHSSRISKRATTFLSSDDGPKKLGLASWLLQSPLGGGGMSLRGMSINRDNCEISQECQPDDVICQPSAPQTKSPYMAPQVPPDTLSPVQSAAKKMSEDQQIGAFMGDRSVDEAKARVDKS